MGGKWAVDVEAEQPCDVLGRPIVCMWGRERREESEIGLVRWVGARLPGWGRVPGCASAQDICVKVTRIIVVTWTCDGTNNYYTPIDY